MPGAGDWNEQGMGPGPQGAQGRLGTGIHTLQVPASGRGGPRALWRRSVDRREEGAGFEHRESLAA